MTLKAMAISWLPSFLCMSKYHQISDMKCVKLNCTILDPEQISDFHFSWWLYTNDIRNNYVALGAK